jgi:glycerate-2-kinase
MYPATIATLVYSDVPGNDLSTIASGPTVQDKSTIQDALHVIKKYKMEGELNLPKDAFVEKPRGDIYFKNVHNIIVLSNETALRAMQEKAQRLGWHAKIFSDRFESEAKLAGKKLISATHHHSILLVGGETTVHVAKKGGKGGRNQELVLAALDHVKKDVVICSFDSDGWDNTENAGAIVDYKTLERCRELGIDSNEHLMKNTSLDFFNKTGDAIISGRLPSNVSDLMIVLRK